MQQYPFKCCYDAFRQTAAKSFIGVIDSDIAVFHHGIERNIEDRPAASAGPVRQAREVFPSSLIELPVVFVPDTMPSCPT